MNDKIKHNGEHILLYKSSFSISLPKFCFVKNIEYLYRYWHKTMSCYAKALRGICTFIFSSLFLKDVETRENKTEECTKDD